MASRRDYDDDDRDRDRPRRSSRDDDDRGRDRDKGGKSGGGFTYRERTAADVNKRATQATGNFDTIIKSSFPSFKPKAGSNTIRIMPPTFDDKKFGSHYGLDIHTHRNVGPDNQQYLCLNAMLGKPCAVCDGRRDMERDGADAEELKETKVTRSVGLWVIDRDEETVGPKFWGASVTMDKDIASRSSDKKTGGILAIDHPEEGYDITFTREGTKLNTRYLGIDIARRSEPLSDDVKQQKKWLNFIMDNPLNDVLNYYDYDYIAAAFSGRKSHKDRDLEEDEDRGGRGSRRSVRDDADDEDRGGRSAPRRGRDSEDEDDRGSARRSVRDDRDEDDRDSRSSRKSSRDDEDEPPRRGRSRDEDDEPPRRGRSRDEEDEPKTSRRSSRDDEDEAPRRGRARDEEDEAPRRGRARDDEDEPKTSRRSSRDDDEPPKTSRRRSTADIIDDDIPFDDRDGKKAGSRARSKADDDGAKPAGKKPSGDVDPTDHARGTLAALKKKHGG